MDGIEQILAAFFILLGRQDCGRSQLENWSDLLQLVGIQHLRERENFDGAHESALAEQRQVGDGCDGARYLEMGVIFAADLVAGVADGLRFLFKQGKNEPAIGGKGTGSGRDFTGHADGIPVGFFVDG